MKTKIILASISIFAFALCIPTGVSATTVKPIAVGDMSESSLFATSSHPIISGVATGTKSVRINLYKEGKNKVYYKSKIIKVKDGLWSIKIPKKLVSGTYDITLYGSKGLNRSTLEKDQLTVSTNTKLAVPRVSTTLIVESVPLLVGGTVRAGKSVPVSYIQVTNVGTLPATVQGFWLKQNGSASTRSIIGLSTIDDSGVFKSSTDGAETTSLFKNNMAFAPVPQVVIEPGKMRLFTIRANVAGLVGPYLGTQLMLDVASIESDAKIKGTFPIKGTTWNIDI